MRQRHRPAADDDGDAQTAAEKTLANAVETGILERDKVVPRLSEMRDKLEAIAGQGVDVSIVKRGRAMTAIETLALAAQLSRGGGV